MKNLSSSHRLPILLMALSVTILIMVPVITGAAPTATPPDGLITPTFSGLNINDAANNNLSVTSTGDISNPSANPVTISDADGFEVADGTTGTAVFRVDASGTVSNPSTTPDDPRPPKSNPITIDDRVSITGSLAVDGNLVAGNISSEYSVNTDNVATDNIYARNMLGGSTINVGAGLALSGKLTASDGIGTIRTYTANSASIANGATGIITRGCDTGVLISCGHNAANNWNVFDSYRNFNFFANPRTRCYAQAKNSTGAAGTFGVVAVCLDAST